MTDAMITEHAGSRHGSIIRFYQYGNGGIRVLDAKKTLRRLYLFDHASNMLTENDPVRREKVLRRFVFDAYGMNEETFSFGGRPRTFRFEDGASRIAVREGGDYGAVGKLFTFEENGVSETRWGRNGEIERAYVFEAGNDAIVERTGGWFGDVDRTIVFDGIDASVFRDPESFLQFLVFTEWSESDREAQINDEVEKIRSGRPAGSSPYAYNGPRRGAAAGPGTGTPARQGSTAPRRKNQDDSGGIDFIPDADTAPQATARGPPSSRRGDNTSYAIHELRQQRDIEAQGRYSQMRSEEISLQDRFEQARSGRGELSKGKSVEIPISDRFEYARQGREELSRGKSVDIPIQDRFERARGEKSELSKGASVDIPLEERFENARKSREKLSKGRSAEIPYDERRSGNR